VALSLLLGLPLGCGSISTPGAAPTDPCDYPSSAVALEDSSHPTTVVGTGTPQSCTADALESAVHAGGVVTFDCGPDPVTITLSHELAIINDAGPNQNGDLLIDGGGKVTLSGGGTTRILRQNGCDESLHWITSHCQDYEHPRLVVQRLGFVDGKASIPTSGEGAGNQVYGGGGAIFIRSGILKVVECTFRNNQIPLTGTDVAGGAIYALSQHGPVTIARSTFGGSAGQGNFGSNGGALGSIGVSYQIVDSIFSGNQATGRGMNDGVPGGGNGGAIYNDGNTYTLSICRSQFTNNSANELAGAVFYVSNDLSGDLVVQSSAFSANAEGEPHETPGFFVLSRTTSIEDTTITR
jgi:hypothetical protein